MRRESRRAAAALLAVGLISAACTSPPTSNDEGGRDAGERGGTHRRNGWVRTACDVPLTLLERTRRGWYPGRGPNLTFIPRDGNTFGDFKVRTTHSGPWSFLQRIPLVFYGPGFIANRGDLRLQREVTLADITPTLATLLDTPSPTTAVGRPIEEVLVPPEQRSGDLRLIMVVVWDGGGWNVLDEWHNKWPFLRSIMERGSSVRNVTVGSSPSITPAVHSTIGTGAFPSRHGIVNILQRQGNRMVAGFGGQSPRRLRVPTLADVYDQRTLNRAQIGMFAKSAMHLGMIGHGARLQGGDHDVAVFVDAGESLLTTHRRFYSIPSATTAITGFDEAAEKLDRADGQLDNRWMGHELPNGPEDEGWGKSPILTLLQTEIIKRILREGGFGEDGISDLFFTNYKDPDYLGHSFNFLSPEVGGAIEKADEALGDLTGFLDDLVGKRKWVLVVTADHGQTPLAEEAGIWPIDVGELERAVVEHVDDDGSDAVDHVKQNGMWLNPSILEASDSDLEDVSNFLLDYTIGDNAEDRDAPDEYLGRLKEPIFDAVFPTKRLDDILSCARKRARL